MDRGTEMMESCLVVTRAIRSVTALLLQDWETQDNAPTAPHLMAMYPHIESSAGILI